MKSPARTTDASRSTFQATTGPNAASSGQNGIPNGQPPRASCGSTSGWKLYGSRQGASPSAEPVPEEPEAVDDLAVVADRGLAVPSAARKVVGAEPEEAGHAASGRSP